MRLTGALSNLQTGRALERALARKRLIAVAGAQSVAGLHGQLKLPLRAIQGAVLETLRTSDGPLRPSEIGARVDERLGRSVSRDTVSSCLSVASRAANSPVHRVRRGLYIVD